MKLTYDDCVLLVSWGYKDKEDLEQINEFLNNGNLILEHKGKKIGVRTALKKLGRTEFLSGLARSSFHWTCTRGEGSNEVDFDCSKNFLQNT